MFHEERATGPGSNVVRVVAGLEAAATSLDDDLFVRVGADVWVLTGEDFAADDLDPTSRPLLDLARAVIEAS